MRVLYGPVDSWRLGRSLGVDPLAQRTKQCPLSCIYCQYGPTPNGSLRRQVWVTSERLRHELVALGPVEADCVTFAGLGEPALALNLADLVAEVRAALPLPVIILTGSALMPLPEVRRDLLVFDAVAVKLDAPDEALFQQINRPVAGYRFPFDAVLNGIRQFRRAYGGRLVLQMMFVQANRHVVPQMAALARSLDPDEVQLDTPLQPAIGGPVSAAQMAEIEHVFAGLPARCIYSDGRANIIPRSM
ncbi:MAG: radical SAM protein [Anaerolineae bacterium]|nr:radical SAM protein [Anaerolineae bacterium]